MTYRTLLAVLLISLATHQSFAQDHPTSRPEEVGFSAAKLAKVSELIQQRVDTNQSAGGVVAISRRGKLVFHEVYRKDGGELLKKDSIFRLYSMSKAITTAAAFMLVDEGKLQLQDPASNYLPELANWEVETAEGRVPPSRAITIKDLMLHTSGMDSNFAYLTIPVWKSKDAAEVIKAYLSVPLAHHPGEVWNYSHSIDLLGLVIEKVSGQPLADFLQERLFDPLGMHDTAFHIPPEQQDRLAGVYRRTKGDGEDEQQFAYRGPNEEEIEIVITQFLSPPQVALGGTGLLGTAKDYILFLQMIANDGQWNGKRYLSHNSILRMTTNQLQKGKYPIRTGEERYGIGFGCGFSVVVDEHNWEGNAPVDEYSWGGAASTHYWVRPEDQLIVVTMEQMFPTNRETRRELRPLIYQAMER